MPDGITNNSLKLIHIGIECKIICFGGDVNRIHGYSDESNDSFNFFGGGGVEDLDMF